MTKELEIKNQIAGLSGSVNAGVVSVESERAVAEAQGQMMLAKRFPRNLASANAELVECCAQESLAKVAFYSVPRGEGFVTGPSIRLAEEIARVCGNIEYGHKELSRDEHKSEVEVYAWEKQTNTRAARHMTVMHVIDTNYGPKPCKSQKDIDDLISNKASKNLRGRILAIVPKWLVESAIDECKKTIAGKSGMPLSQRIRNLIINFAKYGVQSPAIEKKMGKPIDQILEDEFVDLVGVFNAIKEGKKASDYFGEKEEVKNDGLEKQIAQAGKSEAKKEPEAGVKITNSTGKLTSTVQEQAKPTTVIKPAKAEPKPAKVEEPKPLPPVELEPPIPEEPESMPEENSEPQGEDDEFKEF